MTHKQALERIDEILNAPSTTWQEKKNNLADLLRIVSGETIPSALSSNALHDPTDDNFNFE